MPTIESLKRTISSTQDLQSIVRIMKTLAAASIQQCEQAVDALANYTRTIELGLQIVLQDFPDLTISDSPRKGRIGLVVFGSDQGLCGQFNEQIAAYIMAMTGAQDLPRKDWCLIGVGSRTAATLENFGYTVTKSFPMPSSSTSITPMVQELLLYLEANYDFGDSAIDGQSFAQVILCYHQPRSRVSSHPHTVQLLPIDAQWLARLRLQRWEQRGVPTYTMDRRDLFAALIRQFVFVGIYRAFAESLASENASRLAAMHMAEQNINDRLTEYRGQYQGLRQSAITEEILEVLSGFEMLTQAK